MTFEEILDQAIAMLQRRGRLTYSTLKRQFQLDDATLDDLKHELIEGQRLAMDERTNVLVWIGATIPASPSPPTTLVPTETPERLPLSPASLAGERRQVTVLFADISGFTALAETMDPEDVRQVMNACFARLVPLVEDYGGTIDKFIGDEIMALFGAPIAHDNDAERAVHTALAMMEVLHTFNAEQGTTLGLHCGINTGMVIAGGIGTPARQDYSVMGDAVNLAARLGDASERGQIFVGPETYRLTTALFTFERLELMRVKGKAEPVQVYRVLGLRNIQSCPDVGGPLGRVPLVGRDAEVTLLLDLWDQVKEGRGQIVVLNGEGGIGKSRLVKALQDYIKDDVYTSLECRCSPYHQNSAFYPLIELCRRLLRWYETDTIQVRLNALTRFLAQFSLPQEETLALFAALLSLPHEGDVDPLYNLTPQQKRRKTLEALVAMVLDLTSQHPVLLVVEDLHWADPSSLELLDRLVDLALTTHLYILCTSRPTKQLTWANRSYLTQIPLARLTQDQAAWMVERVVGGKRLPSDVLQHVVHKTDGVPLFVEELTKMVLEAGILWEMEDRYELVATLPALEIPTTLYGSLMARLDRLGTAKGVAQLGATLGRQFSYALLHAVSPWDELTLQQALAQLIDAELLYQSGFMPQVMYTFKHVMIQEAAYQSLLRSTQQRYHQCIVQVLTEKFAEIVETQPELLAYHYTEASLPAEAINQWLRAGQQAQERSAHVEAANYFSKGMDQLAELGAPDERAQRELALQLALGRSLAVTKGFSAIEVEQAYTRAQMLCQEIGSTEQLFPILWGLHVVYFIRADLHTAHDVADQLLKLAQHQQDPALLLEAHQVVGTTWFYLGNFALAREHLEQGAMVYDPGLYRTHALMYGLDPGVVCLSLLSWTLWFLGYPAQALNKSHEAVALAQELTHPFSLVFAFVYAARLYQCCRESHRAQKQAEAAIGLGTEQGFVHWTASGLILEGWALSQQGQHEEGSTKICHGLDDLRAIGAELHRMYHLTILAEAYRDAGRVVQSLEVLMQALATVEDTAERWWTAEIYRLNADLLLEQPVPDEQKAEAYIRSALDIARQQESKLLELRATTSLSRLWQRQGKCDKAREVLSAVYRWFTEGLETPDLQEAKLMLQQLTDLY